MLNNHKYDSFIELLPKKMLQEIIQPMGLVRAMPNIKSRKIRPFYFTPHSIQQKNENQYIYSPQFSIVIDHEKYSLPSLKWNKYCKISNSHSTITRKRASFPLSSKVAALEESFLSSFQLYLFFKLW
jgi:hypothetical protein